MTTTETPVLTGADLIAGALAEEGLEHFFNLPGNGVYPMLDPLLDYGIKYVLGLHEGSVVAMADGYARGSGKVPFVNLYMVPGTANGLSSLYLAACDRTPMVVTSTQQTRAIVGRDAYASAPDLLGMVRQYTKWCWEVTQPERLPEAIHRAFKIAATPPRGPVFLSLPVDLFVAPAGDALAEPSRPSAVPSYGPPPEQVIRALSEHLLTADGILLVAGRDVLICDAVSELEALASLVGAAVVSEPWAGVTAFPTPHQLYFGEYGRPIYDRLSPTLVVGLGARLFAEAVRPEPGFPSGTTVANLGLDAVEMGRIVPSDLSGVGDLKAALRALIEACRERVEPARRAARLATIEAYQRERVAEQETLLRERWDRQPMSLARLATALNQVIDSDTLLVEHATTSTGMLMTYLELPNPRNVFGTGGSVQGWGTPAAIGLQLARPERRVLAIVGDGGFTFNCQALWSASKYELPVTIVVLNNRGYRSMRGGVDRNCPRAKAADFDFDFDFEVDIASVARGFGVDCQRVSDPTEVATVVREAISDDRPQVVEVMISPALEFKPGPGAPSAL